MTGQFSWVDALGTRHVTVYRADESGYHILEMRREVGAVAIAPKNEPERPKKIQQVIHSLSFPPLLLVRATWLLPSL